MGKIELAVAWLLRIIGSVLGSAFDIVGVETTQAIQYHRFHPSDPLRSSVLVDGSPRASNSVPLVAGKPTVVRVYVERGPGDKRLYATITGELRIRGRPDVYHSVNLEFAWNAGTLSFRRAGTPGLTFVLPPDACFGSQQLDIEVFGVDSQTRARLVRYYGYVLHRVSFQSVGRIKMRGVLVHYTGRGLDLPAPTGIDVVKTMENVVPVLPTPGIDYDVCVFLDCADPLDTVASWTAAVMKVELLRTLDTADRLFLGMLAPAAPPTGSPAAGIGGGGIVSALATNGDWRSYRHEIGHALGRSHIPGDGAPPYDPYPLYDSYPRSSIGEFGFDPRAPQPPTVFDPAQIQDIMSNASGGLQWISPYTWTALLYAILDRWGDGSVAIPFVDPMPHIKTLSLGFNMNEEGVELELAFPFEQAWSPTDRARMFERAADGGGLRIELYDEARRRIRTHFCRSALCPFGSGESAAGFFERILWSDAARSLRMVDGDRELGTWEVSGHAPTLGDLRVARATENVCHVSWRGAHPDAPIRYAVRYSPDGGKSWIGVVATSADDRAVVAIDALPGGERCCFQVIASAGFRSTIATSEPFTRPRRARSALIVEPPDGAQIEEGAILWVYGGAHSPDYGTPAEQEIVWTTEQRELGRGSRVPVQQLLAGEHAIGVRVPDGQGGFCTATRRVSVRSRRLPLPGQGAAV